MNNEGTGTTQGHDSTDTGTLLSFDATRRRNCPEPRIRLATEIPHHEGCNREQRQVVAVVTVTRFIGNEKVHAQVPVFAEEIHGEKMIAADLKLTPELSELLADGAVEANSYLDRLTATRAARPLGDYYAAVNS
jgi:hypothetical protein